MQGGQSYRTQEMAEIRTILTPDQQAKFDARQKSMAERGKGGHKGWSKKGKTAPAAKS
jgi:Spy/CpxP family protein refolding chaperone